MGNDTVSVTTQTSWFSRLGASIKGIVFGFVLVIAGIILLAWNEGRSVKAIRAHDEGARSVLSVASDRVNPTNAGKLIHVSGPVQSTQHPEDSSTRVSASALVLARRVEHFAWVESRNSTTRTKLGGGEETVTTYNYEQQWTATMPDSSKFHEPNGHTNPAAQLNNETLASNAATLGSFTLPRDLLSQLPATEPLALTPQQIQSARFGVRRPTHAIDGGMFVGIDPNSPRVGDMRVSYTILPQASVVSIVGAQQGNSFAPFRTANGSTLLIIQQGSTTADAMFDGARSASSTMTWAMRGLGLVLLIAALKMILSPLAVVADIVPIAGTIMRTGSGLIASVLGLSIASIVIAISWLAYRPILSAALLAIAALLSGVVYWCKGRKNGSVPT